MLALYVRPHWPIMKYNMKILELMSCPTDITETYLSVYTVSLLGRAYVCTALGKIKFWIVIAVHMHCNTTSNTTNMQVHSCSQSPAGILSLTTP